MNLKEIFRSFTFKHKEPENIAISLLKADIVLPEQTSPVSSYFGQMIEFVRLNLLMDQVFQQGIVQLGCHLCNGMEKCSIHIRKDSLVKRVSLDNV